MYPTVSPMTHVNHQRKNWRFALHTGDFVWFLSLGHWCDSGQGHKLFGICFDFSSVFFENLILCLICVKSRVCLYDLRGIYWVRKTPGIFFHMIWSNLTEPSCIHSGTNQAPPPNATCPPRNNASPWLSHILFIHNHNPLMIPLIRPAISWEKAWHIGVKVHTLPLDSH